MAKRSSVSHRPVQQTAGDAQGPGVTDKTVNSPRIPPSLKHTLSTVSLCQDQTDRQQCPGARGH